MKWLALMFLTVVAVCSCTGDAVQVEQPEAFAFDTTVVCDTIEF